LIKNTTPHWIKYNFIIWRNSIVAPYLERLDWYDWLVSEAKNNVKDRNGKSNDADRLSDRSFYILHYKNFIYLIKRLIHHVNGRIFMVKLPLVPILQACV